MTQGKLESQIHDSGKVGESWLFMGFMTPDEPDFRPFSYFDSADASTTILTLYMVGSCTPTGTRTIGGSVRGQESNGYAL